ncbi:MAG: hypothetical protein GY797_05210 [Deltaproteobacteria bacterium]|nr:hypothetical protein [Deltaproteobacteria bacterium]
MRYLIHYSILMVFLLPSSFALSSDDIVKQLTGNGSKTWQVEAFDINLGSDSKCNEGIQYIFKFDKTLEIRSCVNSKVNTATHTWVLSNDDIDTYIKIDNNLYRLIYSKHVNELGMREEELVLRDEGSKTTQTIDIIMSNIP